jgi:probable rRNA maturation factor
MALGLSRSGLARFLREAQRVVGLVGSVDVLLADDRTLRRLNRDFRGTDKATDVLSFPAAEEMAGEFAGRFAGDLAISVETAARQAGEHGHSLRDEVRVLLLHGLLHLSGMDHEMDRGEMAAREAELRERLRLKSGLIARVEGADRQLPPGEKRSRFPCTPASKLAGDPASGMTERKAKAKAKATTTTTTTTKAKAKAKATTKAKAGTRSVSSFEFRAASKNGAVSRKARVTR